MSNYNRIMELDLPKGQSAFLWGARNTGKSTYLHQKYPDSIYYDLLLSDTFLKLQANPAILREELLAAPSEKLKRPIIIDEVQKIPALLDEIHWLIENKKLAFILCGSSTRKLKRGAANLLGGRAWKFHFYPLTFKEIDNFNLLQALSHGLIPSIYNSSNPNRSFTAYVDMYLKEEIQAEGIVRNLPGFARFLDLVGFSNGEMLNYKKIATDCAVDAKTVKEYYQILVDTLIAYLVQPFTKTKKRQLISATPKFYLFDVGIANYLSKKTVTELRGTAAGDTLEHYILMELTAYIGINELRTKINYWRTKSGLEVDFVLNDGDIAIEVKISNNPRSSDYKGLTAFCNDYKPKEAIVVCLASQPRITENNIKIYPWEMFLTKLWAGEIVKQ